MYKLFRTMSSNSKTLINITTDAWSKMHSIWKASNNDNFLFAANPGGCSGLNYEFRNISSTEIAQISGHSRIQMTYLERDGLKVHIDPLSEMYLLGTTIDYVFEDYAAGIYESKFVFNPDRNVAGTCGCGVSFYMK